MAPYRCIHLTRGAVGFEQREARASYGTTNFTRVVNAQNSPLVGLVQEVIPIYYTRVVNSTFVAVRDGVSTFTTRV